MRRITLISPWFAGFCLATVPLSARAGVFYPRQELANQSAGILETEVRGGSYRGSATVARDGRLIYSCAHVFYDRGVWASDYWFTRAWHDRRFPRTSEAASPRGFHYFTDYANAARFTDGESNASFAADFTVMYGYESFGPAALVRENSGRTLLAQRPKRIIGYPAELDFTGARGFCYQHATPWFNNRAYRIRDGFMEFNGVSTGSGNSGGGIFIRDLAGRDRLAGILVSGGYRTAGVVAMDADTRSLASDALGSVGTETFTASGASTLVVSSVVPTTLPIHMVINPSLVAGLRMQMEWNGTSAAPPAVMLQSPGGRVRPLAVTSTAAEGGRFVLTADGSDAFRGSAANGCWKVRLRAPETGDITCHGIKLEVDTRIAADESP